jgi:hypothetical protein
MKNSSTILKRVFLALAFMTAALCVYTPAGAEERGAASAPRGSHSNACDNPSDNHSGNDSRDVGLILSLTRSLSLDLKLGSVDTGQTPAGEKQLGAPPIPISKAPGSDLRYSRLGVGFTLGF